MHCYSLSSSTIQRYMHCYSLSSSTIQRYVHCYSLSSSTIQRYMHCYSLSSSTNQRYVTHRSRTSNLHLLLFLASFSSSLQDFSLDLCSCSVDLRHVALCRPLFVLPSGFQFNASNLVTLSSSFRSVCPNQPHWRCRICILV